MNASIAVRLGAVFAWSWIALLGTIPVSHGSTLLTFDDLSPGTVTLLIPNGYGGLTWSNFYAYNGTLAQPAYGYFKGIVSTANVALNGFADPSGFSSSSLIDLNSAYMTAAFDDGLHVRVQGISGTNLLYDNTYVLGLNAPTLINFNYLQIDKVLFQSTPARNFVVDNLSISSTNPIAIFATLPNSGHLPLTVQFIDQSTGAMTNWDWDFGDGTPHSTAQNPSHTYSADRVYSVTLVATATGGISRTNTRTLSVTPAANFSAIPT